MEILENTLLLFMFLFLGRASTRSDPLFKRFRTNWLDYKRSTKLT